MKNTFVISNGAYLVIKRVGLFLFIFLFIINFYYLGQVFRIYFQIIPKGIGSILYQYLHLRIF